MSGLVEDAKPNTTIDKLSEFADKAVTIRGWVYNKRSSGKINFVLVRDGFGIAQCVVVKNQVKPEVFADYDLLTQESSLIVTGKVHKDDRAPGGYELPGGGYEDCPYCERISYHPKGTWYRVSNGSPPSLVALVEAARNTASQASNYQGYSRVFRRPWLYSCRFANSHSGIGGGNEHAFRDGLL